MLPHPIHDPLILHAPPTIDDARLGEALLQYWGRSGTLCSLGGERDRNFRLDGVGVGSFLIKVTHPDEDPAITELQSKVLLHLASSDPALPVPRVVLARDGSVTVPYPAADGRACMLRVLTYLPGRPLLQPESAAALGELAARLDAALSGFAHPADGRRLLWDIREAPGLRVFLGEVGDTGLRALAEAALDRFEAGPSAALARLPMQLIHNDLNPHNVMADGDGNLAGIIDFGDMVRAPLLQEVATACAYLVRPGDAPLAGPAAFLSGYRRLLPLPEEQAALLPALIATRMAMTVLITHWRAGRHPENAAYILRNMPSARVGLECLAGLTCANLEG